VPEGYVLNQLAVVVDGSRPPGLYRWLSRAHPAAVGRHLGSHGVETFVLDGVRVCDAEELFVACAAALRFPDWFAEDWESLAECLADLSWLPGRARVLIWDHYGTLARHDAPAWETARDLFAFHATASAEDGTPLYVLLRGAGPARDVPVL
jgi:hypothetical protein